MGKFFGYLGAIVGGLFVLIVFSGMVLGLLFGVERRDSSAAWGLSGAAPELLAIMSTPLYVIIFAVAAVAYHKKYEEHATAALLATLWSIGLTLLLMALFWLFLGKAKPILRSSSMPQLLPDSSCNADYGGRCFQQHTVI